MSPPRIKEALARLPILRCLDAERLRRIASGTSAFAVDKGEWVFRPGDPCTGFYAVVRGSVKVAFVSRRKGEKVVAIARPGETFGEATVFLGRPRMMSARALGQSLLLHISAHTIAEQIGRHAPLARSMLSHLSQRLRQLARDAGANTVQSSSQRLVAYLLGDALPAAAPFQVTLPRKDALASRLDMTPEHFSRLLRRLDTRGLIAVDGRVVRVLDPVALRAGAA